MNVDRNNSGGFGWGGLLQWTLGCLPISQKVKIQQLLSTTFSPN